MKTFHKQVVEAVEYLKNVGAPFRVLRDLHHTDTLVSNYSGTLHYWSTTKSCYQDNFDYGMRIIRYANLHHQNNINAFSAGLK